MNRAAWGIVISVAVMAPVAAWLARSDGTTGGPDAAAARFIAPEACRPEPGEKAAFMACALGLPALIFATVALGRPRGPTTRRGDLVSLAFVVAAAGAAWVGVRAEADHALLMNPFARGAGRAAILFAASAALVWRGRRGGPTMRRCAGAAAVLAIASAAALRVFDETAREAWTGHFEPVYHPVVQVALGKTVLVNATSQYGLFPHFLAPIVSLTGLSVLAFTTVMAALVAAVLAGIWGVLRGASENRVVAAAGLMAVIVNGSVPLFEANDPYFQYMPIRMVAPVLSLWLTWRYLGHPSRRRYWMTMLALGLGSLWNLDTGVPAMASWIGVLAYGELAAAETLARKVRRIVGHVLAGGAGVMAAVLGYAIAVFFRTGRWPDFLAFLEFQRIFYGSGFYMLPMPAMGGWWAVAIVYLIGLAYAAGGLNSRFEIRDSRVEIGDPRVEIGDPRVEERGRGGRRAAIVFHLATLGIGLFSYYQGRSHPRVLSLVWWPAYVLMALFLDELIAGMGRGPARISRLAAAGVLTWVVAGPAWSIVERGPFLKAWYGGHLVAALRHRAGPTVADVASIRRAMRRGERVLTISRNESLLSARLGRPSEWRSSLIEALLVEDFRAMARRIDRGEFDRIWVGRTVLNGGMGENRGIVAMAEVLRRGVVIEETTHGFLIDPSPDRGANLAALPPTPAPVRLHAVHGDGRFDARPPLPPMALGESFTIEAIVRPDGDQPPSATLFGNHPGGARANSGFTVQRSGAAGDEYVGFVGDGRTYHLVSTFRLDPGRWSLLTIAVGDGSARTHVDGRLADSRTLPAGLSMLDSDLPVLLGDWHPRHRPFRGLIAELRISDGAVPGDEVARRFASSRPGIEAIAAREMTRR